MTSKILVTGGAGFIGAHLVSQLTAQGEQVRVLDIAPRPADLPAAIDWQQGSILDAAALERAVTDAPIIFHLAALAHLGVPDTKRYEQINLRGTQNIIAATKRHQAKHLLITSTEVILRGWRDPHPDPLTVTANLPNMQDMAGPYCRSKLAAEIATRQAIADGQPISILYPTVPIGPGDHNLTAPTAMLRQFLKSPPPAFLDCRLNLVAAEDVARAHILAAKKPAGQTYMIGGEDVDMAQILSWLAPLTDKKMPRKAIPYQVAALTAQIAALTAKLTGKVPLASIEGVRLARHKVDIDSRATVKALGWEREPVKQAVIRAANWLDENALL